MLECVNSVLGFSKCAMLYYRKVKFDGCHQFRTWRENQQPTR